MRRIAAACLLLLVLVLMGARVLTSAGVVPVAETNSIAVAPSPRLPAYFVADETGTIFRGDSGVVSISLAPDGVDLELDQTHFGLHLVGTNPGVQLVGGSRVQATANYYIGNDPARWREHVPMYTQVTYQGIYPGVNLTYESRDGALKSEFVVQPGAALDQIQVEYDGVSSLALGADGELVIEVAGGGTLRETIPSAYQEIDGQRIPVDVEFRLVDERSYGFAIRGEWDPSAPLVIDPALLYATFLGGSARDEGWSIDVDNSGNTYISGITYSTDFPCVNPAQPTYAGGDFDAFVAKFGAAGELVYVTFFGGSASEEGNGIGIDGSGNAYVAGETYSVDFPILNAWQPYFAGQEDAYVLKLDASGELAYSTFIGGSSADEADDITVDYAGNAYVVGEVYSDDFPLRTPWQSQTYGQGDEDGFISVFHADGSLVYSTYIAANQRDQVFRIAVDDEGYIYAAGMTSSPSFPVVNPLQANYGGDWDDCLILKFDPQHNQMLYATFLGGSGRDECWGIAVDREGNAFVTGFTSSRDFPLANPAQSTYAGGEHDAFVAKLNPDGSALVYSTFIGGSDTDQAWDLAVDGGGNAYVTGRTNSQNFPLVDALQPRFGGGGMDGFLLRFDAAGALRYSSFLGGLDRDEGWGLVVDRDWVVHVTGATWSWDMPTRSSIQQYQGQSDAFVARFALAPTPTPTPTPTPFASGAIGPDGGALWLAYPEHLTLLDIPPGTLHTNTTFTLTYSRPLNTQGDLQGSEHFFSLEAAPPVSPGIPMHLSLGFSSVGLISNTIDLYRLEAGSWLTSGFTVTERMPNYIVASVVDMGTYGILGRTNRVYLPLVLRSGY